MLFHVEQRVAKAGAREGSVYVLGDMEERCQIEVWPQWGFNCLRWNVTTPEKPNLSIFYCDPNWANQPVPTRSGHPILFPFPGRMRAGKLVSNGVDRQLPLNDSSGKHAIHGFTPRNRWRVIGTTMSDEAASITGEFHLSKDFPAALAYWPSDFRIQVEYRIMLDRLIVRAQVENCGSEPLPWGLGYHGYFQLAHDKTAVQVEDLILQTDCDRYWNVDDELLPTGEHSAVSENLDFRSERKIAATILDHVYSTPAMSKNSTSRRVATIKNPNSGAELTILASPDFRELVLFTPQHRQAVAIEPYTCSADAARLQIQGIDSGWQHLPSARSWYGEIEYRLTGQ